jgi:hypothetical protein
MSHPAKFSRMRRRNLRRLSQPHPPRSFRYWLRVYFNRIPRSAWAWWDNPTPLARYLENRSPKEAGSAVNTPSV